MGGDMATNNTPNMESKTSGMGAPYRIALDTFVAKRKTVSGTRRTILFDNRGEKS